MAPETNIVNFRYRKAPLDQLNEVNARLRQQLIEQGQFYIVQTVLKEEVYLRCSIMHPLTKAQDMKTLLEEIKKLV